MKQDSSTGYALTGQVNVIDKTTVPAGAFTAFSEKSGYIRKFLRKQPGFVKDETFQHTDDNGNFIIITVATWASRQQLDNVRTAMQEEMKKTGLNMPEFLKQQGIAMERGIYFSVAE